MATPISNPARPFANCYWVQPGRLLAGEYPGDWSATTAVPKLNLLLAAGVTFFLDLTHPADGLESYAPLLPAMHPDQPRPIVYQRMAIPDRSVPPVAQMVQTLDVIDAALAAGQVVYVHCWGGVGRTGTVVGCHLVRHGRSGEAALAEIARLWQDMAKRDRYPHSPETAAQAAMVRTWTETTQFPISESTQSSDQRNCL